MRHRPTHATASATALLQRAHRANMDVCRYGDQIKVTGGGPDVEEITAELTLRKAEVLALLSTPALDWRTHAVGRPAPCRLCGRPAMMRDADGLPCHKVCAEDDLARPRRRP